MELGEAYKVLEVTPGASEEAVRDARKLLAKVWHPDRHANDPELEKRAQQKLADINTAFEAIRDAKFPSAGAANAKAAPPKAEAKPGPVAAMPKAGAKPEPAPPAAASNLELVPRRRVRWSVIFLLLAAVGAGAYFAILKLGAKAETVTPVVTADAAVVATVADAATAVTPTIVEDATPTTAGDAAVPSSTTFGLGASQAEVQAAMGVPDTLDHSFDQWRYGFSIIYFKEGKVTGWWKRDRPLRVHLDPKDPDLAAKAVAAGSFAIGADPDEVIALQGTPDRIDPDFSTWYYNGSSIELDGRGKVTGWHSVNNTLKIKSSD